MYGLETIHLTQALSKSLGAVQMRTLRKILQRPSSFVDRRYANQKILDEATSIAFPIRGDTRKIIRFSEYHLHRRAKLLGRILRSSNGDPLRQVSFLLNSASRVDYGKKRVGKPRQNWLHRSKSFVYEHILRHRNFDELTDDDCVYAAAMNIDPFKRTHLVP